jgi:hypothetical protein
MSGAGYHANEIGPLPVLVDLCRRQTTMASAVAGEFVQINPNATAAGAGLRSFGLIDPAFPSCGER